MTPFKSRLTAHGAVLGLLLSMVTAFEGYVPTAEPDPIGVPTYCYGETEDVQVGVVYSEAECRAKLAAKLPRYEQGMAACIKDPDHVPDPSYVAFISFTYNVGVGAFCNSTLVRKLNAGDLRGACLELPRWVYAGGRMLPGLVTRRADEEKLCLQGVK